MEPYHSSPNDPRNSPFTSPIARRLRELHLELSEIRGGEVATHLPELANANPNWFAIAVVTTNGGLYEVGDSRQTFTLQSLAKPFVYGLALEDRGREKVMAKVGVEPTGDAPNSIHLQAETGRPLNPMTDAGAIACTGLVKGATGHTRLSRIVDLIHEYTGRVMDVDEEAYRSASARGHRERAIGHLLRNFGILEDDPMPVVETYFQQSAILAHCVDLATMAATLANRGLNPLTGQQTLPKEYAESVLGMMGTCGMHDHAGDWFYEVGMPAKSGLSGGIFAVLRGQLGIGVFSPRLDARGNSVRGIRACSALARMWDLHLFNGPGAGKGVMRHQHTIAELGSSRLRGPRERAALVEHATDIMVYHLQGNLYFANAEVILREICIPTSSPKKCVILDFKHVTMVNESACALLHDLLLELLAGGCQVCFAGLQIGSPQRRAIEARMEDCTDTRFQIFDECDRAMQDVEDRLLTRLFPPTPAKSIGVDNYELLHGMTPDEVATFRKFLKRKEFKAGETIFEMGSPARDIYLLARGRVTAFMPSDQGEMRRLAVFTAGMAFGEMAVLDGKPRSATMIAEEESACDLLSVSRLQALSAALPYLKIRILENLALGLCQKLRKANQEVMLRG
jgi:glutaminase